VERVLRGRFAFLKLPVVDGGAVVGVTGLDEASVYLAWVAGHLLSAASSSCVQPGKPSQMFMAVVQASSSLSVIGMPQVVGTGSDKGEGSWR